MDSSNLKYSGDFVGEMCRLVKGATRAECLYIQGGCGDINPYLDKTSINKGGVASMRETGRIAAQSVLDVLDSIHVAVPKNPSIRFGEVQVPVGLRWDVSDDETRRVFFEAHQWLSDLFTYYGKHLVPDLRVSACALVLNGDLAFAGVPGEFFTRYQLDLKATAPVKHALLCGYTNAFHLYFPTLRDAVAGGYGGTVASYVGLGAGDKVMTEIKILLAELVGKARRYCIPEDFEIKDV